MKPIVCSDVDILGLSKFKAAAGHVTSGPWPKRNGVSREAKILSGGFLRKRGFSIVLSLLRTALDPYTPFCLLGGKYFLSKFLSPHQSIIICNAKSLEVLQLSSNPQ